MDHARQVREALRVRCVHLKTKSAYVGLPGPTDVPSPCDTAIWWCERTCKALGPDGSSASPRDGCETPGRTCYEPPVHP